MSTTSKVAGTALVPKGGEHISRLVEARRGKNFFYHRKNSLMRYNISQENLNKIKKKFVTSERRELKMLKQIKKLVSTLMITTLFLININTFAHPLQVVSFVKETVEVTKQNVVQKATVNGKSMSVSVQGSGEKTIVILSGWGTENPIEDFAELAEKLSDTYKIVTIEYFGYGKSDDIAV